MKVLMLGWEYPPFFTGGLGIHSRGLTEGLVKQGIDVTFIMPSGKGNIEPGTGVKIISAGRKKIIPIPSKLRPYTPSTAFSASHIQGAGGRSEVYGWDILKDVVDYAEMAAAVAKDESFDIIHCHDWMTFLAGIKIKKESGKPLVITVHSTEFDRSGMNNMNNTITHIEWLGMYEADRVITVSNYMKVRLMEFYKVPDWKIDVIYNAVDEEYHPDLGSKPGKMVLFLGRLVLQKGPDYFLMAAKKVLEKEKDVTFVIVGKGDMLPQLISMAINLGISDHVFFAGYQDDIKKYYQAADLYVMPSVSEPFGITALEAMSSGTPVLVSKQSGVSEAVRHRITADFWDVDDIASKIIGVLKYAPVKRLMIRNGLHEVKGFRWEEIAKITMGVYSKVIGSSR
jgi:glycogen(starch) synthase